MSLWHRGKWWLGMLTVGCASLDPLLFAPVQVAADVNLLTEANQIPTTLLQSNLGIVSEDQVPVDAALFTHSPNDGTNAMRHSIAILYCHGNAGNLSGYVLRAQALWSLGYTVLLFDYRGYGKTPGIPSEVGVYRDARAARSYLQARSDLGLSANQTVLYGYSLGGAVCSQLAYEAPSPVLILESTFSSIANLVADNLILAVGSSWFADAQMNTIEKIAHYHQALLVMHGLNDTYLKPEYGQALVLAAQTIANPVHSYFVAGATHNDVPCQLPQPAHSPLGGCGNGFAAVYNAAITSFIDATLLATH